MVVPGSIPNMMRSLDTMNDLKSQRQGKMFTFAPMTAIAHKAKQFLVFTIKVLIVSAAFYFIVRQLQQNSALSLENVQQLWTQNLTWTGVLLLILLSFLNRFFEILKWQTLVSSFQKITLTQAAAQVLGALTAGIFTPNGLGEYAGKALFYPKTQTKRIVFLNLICNGVQMLYTIGFGLLGLLCFNAYFGVVSNGIVGGFLAGLIAVFAVLFFSRSFTIRGYSIQKLMEKINEIPRKIHQKNLLLGLGRYLVFSHQYYFLFLVFDVQQPYWLLMSGITSVYFLASSLPSFQFLDFALKGSMAVLFFGPLGINDWIPVFITALMWFLNVVIPVVIGSYFVLNFKTKP